MRNKILNYDLEAIDETYEDSNGNTVDFEYNVPDYFSKNIFISDILEELEDYLQIYQCTDGDKLERISDELYGTTDYWDIIALLNEKNIFFDMPYDSNTLYESANLFANIYFYRTGLNNPNRTQSLENEWYDETVQNNEKYRIMLVPKPHLINDVIRILKNNDYI